MPIKPGRVKGTWRVWVQLPNRKQRERTIKGSYKLAQAEHARMQLERDGSQPPNAEIAQSFADFCVQRYRPHAKLHLKPTTWSQVRKYQVETLIGHFGPVLLTELTRAHVEAYQTKRIHTLWRGKPIRPSAINNELRVFRTILNYAISLPVPCAAFTWKKLPVRGGGRAKAWSHAQLQKLFGHAGELRGVFVFLANTGCRKGEAIAVEWSWVDLPGRMLRIPSNEVWQPKNGEPREVPLSDTLHAFLEGTHSGHPKYVFVTKHGGRYARFPKDVWKKVRDAAAVPGTPHWFRHTFASHFLSACPDLGLLASVLGHSHQRVTELYSHMLPDHLARARNVVNIAPSAVEVAPEAPTKKVDTRT